MYILTDIPRFKSKSRIFQKILKFSRESKKLQPLKLKKELNIITLFHLFTYVHFDDVVDQIINSFACDPNKMKIFLKREFPTETYYAKSFHPVISQIRNPTE